MDDVTETVLGEGGQERSEWVLELVRFKDSGWLRLDQHWQHGSGDGPFANGTPGSLRIAGTGYSVRLAVGSPVLQSELRESIPLGASNISRERETSGEQEDSLQAWPRVDTGQPETASKRTFYLSSLPTDHPTQSLPDAAQVEFSKCAHEWESWATKKPYMPVSWCSQCGVLEYNGRIRVPRVQETTLTSAKPESQPSVATPVTESKDSGSLRDNPERLAAVRDG